jgi:hypothetical protein
MKVAIVGGNTLSGFGLLDRLNLEEEDVVGLEQTDIHLDVRNFESFPLADINKELCFGSASIVPPPSGDTYYLVRVFDNERWGTQTGVGVPLIGSMSEGLGAPIPMGSVGMFKDVNVRDDLFENKTLGGILQGLKWRGFVTLEMSRDQVCKIHLGCPSFLAYGLMECFGSRLGDFARDPLSARFKSRWVCASLLSCYPYPVQEWTEERMTVSGLTRDVRKHFWSFAPTGIMKESFKTKFTALGVVTAWDRSLDGACHRVGITSANVEVMWKQYRRDLWVANEKYDEVSQFL